MIRPHILVVGSTNTDMVIHLPTLPRAGETLLGGQFMMAAGGKGANQAVSAARAGGRVTFISRLGEDLFGQTSMASLKMEGIDVSHVYRDRRAPSGVALIFVDRQGENCIAVAGGANQRLSRADVKKAAAALQGAKAVLIQLETPLPTVAAAIGIAHRAGVPVILNPAPSQPLPDEILRKVAVLTPNESEAEALTGITVDGDVTAHQAANALLARGVRAVIITLGKRGAWLADAGGSRLIAGIAMQAVDTTAAGDVFNGALAVAMGEGESLPQAVRFANAAAAISVTRRGAQPSAPTRSEIAALLGKVKQSGSRARQSQRADGGSANRPAKRRARTRA